MDVFIEQKFIAECIIANLCVVDHIKNGSGSIGVAKLNFTPASSFAFPALGYRLILLRRWLTIRLLLVR